MTKFLFVLLLLLFGCTAIESSTPLEPTSTRTIEVLDTPSPVATLPPTMTAPPLEPSATSDAVMIDIEIDQPVTIGVGETLQFDSHQLTLTAVTNDSRCPVDVDCFWAGEATAEFTSDVGAFALTIGGGDFVDDRSSHQIGDFVLTVESLTPTPHSEKSIAQADYRVTLRLTR